MNFGVSKKVLLVVFLTVIFLFTLNSFKEADSFYHLRTGQLIWETRSIPHVDVFSITAAGRPWVTHEWLSELTFYGVYRLAGYWGVIVFCALLAVLTYFLLYRLALLFGASPYVFFPLAFLCGILAFELWIARPQVFAYLFFVAELLLLERWRRREKIPRETRNDPVKAHSAHGAGRRASLFWMVPLIFLWANMHASVVLGLALILCYALGASLKKYAPRFFGMPRAYEKPGIVWAVFVATAAAAFLNPNGYKVLTYSFTVAKSIGQLKIEEWLPITAFFNEWGARAFAVELVLIAGFFVWQFFRHRERRDITTTALVLGVSVLPFIAVRHAGWWPLAVVAPLAGYISKMFVIPEGQQGYPESSTSIKSGSRVKPGMTERAIVVAGIILIVFGIWRVPRTYFNPDMVPVYAVDFIQKENIPGPFYNFYNHGGYFIWRFWPQEKVFIDGRSEVFAGTPTAEFLKIANDQDFDALVNQKYKLNYFVLPYRPEAIEKSLFPLYQRLIKDGWIFVWWDDSAVVFVRSAPQNFALASRYAIRHVGPWTDPATIPATDRRAAAAELEGLLERVPQSVVVRGYTQQFLAH
jgi:hypothetical protein